MYRLTGPAAGARGQPLALAISVARPRSASSLDTERIAVVKPGYGFDHLASARWADPAPQMVQQLLVGALAADGGFAVAVAAPSRVPTDLLLDVELRHFEAVYAAADAPPRVRVGLQVNLVDTRRGVRIASFESNAEAAAERNDRRAVVAAFEQASSEAVRDAAVRVREAAAGSAR
jgi:cholesterol transport system auxiliary component